MINPQDLDLMPKETRVYKRELAILLESEVNDLANLCAHVELIIQNGQPLILNSGGIYRVIMETNRCEELIDQLHAGSKPDWINFRKQLAIIKHTSHILGCLSRLHLLNKQLQDTVEGNFPLALSIMKSRFTEVFSHTCGKFLKECKHLQIVPENFAADQLFDKYFVPDIEEFLVLQGQPLEDEEVLEEVEEMSKYTTDGILYRASYLLNLCDKMENFTEQVQGKTSQRSHVLSEVLSEESLNQNAELFHSIVTMCDTWDTQQLYVKIPKLKDLLTFTKVLFQLLSAASAVMRIYERHLDFFINRKLSILIDHEEIEEMLFDFYLLYAERFRLKAQQSSRLIIQEFSSFERIELPIPVYRGFHVRPSTLIARIVMHYGGKVIMELDHTQYNAAVPLDLFRANEKINAEKRREIANLVLRNKSCLEITNQLSKDIRRVGGEEAKLLMQNFFLKLISSLHGEEKIVTYDKIDLSSLEQPSIGEGFLEYVKREIAYLMATGKIDVSSSVLVAFEGDSRILADIVALANCGYGEDRMGNNINLPQELSYLRR